jgi:hypothetical protein
MAVSEISPTGKLNYPPWKIVLTGLQGFFHYFDTHRNAFSKGPRPK